MNNTAAQHAIDDKTITIRPILATDGVMEAEFVRNLSDEMKHFRFLGGVSELRPADLKRLCEVDGSHSMAFVATVQTNGRETEIGVCRYGEGSKDEVLELAITVADAWQRKGLAELLLETLITYARSHGVRQLYSIEFADNTAMRELAGELGMSVTSDPDDPKQVVYSLALQA